MRLPRDEILLKQNFILRGGVGENRTRVQNYSFKIIYKLSRFFALRLRLKSKKQTKPFQSSFRDFANVA